MSPYKCPSLFTILAFLEYEYGVFHPRGGCGAVMEAMARVARDLGVRIRTNTMVEQIVFKGRRATGVRTRAGQYDCDALVINADFAGAISRLVPDGLRRRWTDAKLARKRFSCSTFMLYLGIAGRVDLDHHTIFLAEDYARNLKEIEEGRVLPRSPSLYIQNACVTDAGQAPQGCSTLYVLVPVPHHSPHIDWRRGAAGYRALVLRRLAALGLGDIERRIRVEKMMTPVEWRNDLDLTREPPSTSRTACGKSCICGPVIASRIWQASTSSAGARIPAAACRSFSRAQDYLQPGCPGPRSEPAHRNAVAGSGRSDPGFPQAADIA